MHDRQQKCQRAVHLMAGILKGIALYPAAHPALVKPLQELVTLLADLFKIQPELHLGVMDDILFFDRILFVNPTPSEEEIAAAISSKSIEAITLQASLKPAELALFLNLLSQDMPGEKIAAELAGRQIEHIRVQNLERREKPKQQAVSGRKGYKAYKKAVDVIQNAFKEMENGRIPTGKDIFPVVDDLVDLAAEDSSAMMGLALIKDYDNYTFNHSVNVGIIAITLGHALGMERQEVRNLGVAGLLHDIGKITIKKSILNKPGKLSAAEYEEIKKHAENGAKIISRMEGMDEGIALAVLGHHIMENRQGYPEWARNRAFDVGAGVIAIADCYDAITTLRVYQRPTTPREALERLRDLSGTYLNASLVDRFIEMMGKYPVGTMVRLDTNEIAVVVKSHPNDTERCGVKIIFSSNGERLDKPVEKETGKPGIGLPAIVATVDPLTKNIEVEQYVT